MPTTTAPGTTAAATAIPERVTKLRINRRPIIYITANVISLPNISTVDQHFRCEFVLRGWSSGLKGARVWTDRTRPAPAHIDAAWLDDSCSRPLLAGEYDPRLSVANLVGAAELWRFDAKWLDGPGGEMEFKWRTWEQIEPEAVACLVVLQPCARRSHMHAPVPL